MVENVARGVRPAAARLLLRPAAQPSQAAFALLVALVLATGAAPAHADEVLYTQFWLNGSVNASTAFNSEVADDVPTWLEGELVGSVILYVAEWMGTSWMEPLGIDLSFYYASCPPAMAPDLSYSYDWSDLHPVLVYNGPPGNMFVKSVELQLPQELEVTAALSIGATVRMNWGPAPPYCGFCVANYGAPSGCGEMYWDNPDSGAPRWTPISSVLSFTADLAYSLRSPQTGIAEEPVRETWTRLKALYR